VAAASRLRPYHFFGATDTEPMPANGEKSGVGAQQPDAPLPPDAQQPKPPLQAVPQ
jgi:hypothetical protein